MAKSKAKLVITIPKTFPRWNPGADIIILNEFYKNEMDVLFKIIKDKKYKSIDPKLKNTDKMVQSNEIINTFKFTITTTNP